MEVELHLSAELCVEVFLGTACRSVGRVSLLCEKILKLVLCVFELYVLETCEDHESMLDFTFLDFRIDRRSFVRYVTYPLFTGDLCKPGVWYDHALCKDVGLRLCADLDSGRLPLSFFVIYGIVPPAVLSLHYCMSCNVCPYPDEFISLHTRLEDSSVRLSQVYGRPSCRDSL